MRFINKRAVCKPLKRRRHNLPQTNIDAKRAWRRFNKKAIRKACYKQQLGLCAYTELPLDDKAIGCHIEHIAPRSHYPARTFKADNIILAALDENHAGQLSMDEQFGGHFKQARYGDDWFIGPFDERCELFFRYCDKTGYMYANTDIHEVDQIKTTRTINTLNLNCDFLIALRQQHLQDLNSAISALKESSSLIQLDVFTLFKTQTLQLTENKLPIFFSAKKQLLERIEEELINNVTTIPR